jgi:hypothetical protein
MQVAVKDEKEPVAGEILESMYGARRVGEGEGNGG